MFDILSDLSLTRGANQTLSGVTPNNSALIDMRGYQALTAYLMAGTVTDAGDANGFTMKLQHSDSTVAGTFVDVPAANVSGTVTVTSDDADNVAAGGIRYTGNRRYVRAVITGTTGTNAVVYVLFLRGKPSSTSAPVATIGATTAAT
jgi:hypothetical protein